VASIFNAFGPQVHLVEVAAVAAAIELDRSGL
jgi:hypothetical protein